MQRFFVETPLRAGGADVALPATAARQVTTVLRMRLGDQLVLFDGRGGEWLAEVSSLDRRAVRARLVAFREPATEPDRRITLCQALLKAEKFEWVLQKGTELGVASFVPLRSQRVVGADRSANGVGDAKMERWRRIVVEAAEQSGRVVVPGVEPARSLAAALRLAGGTVLCWEEEHRQGFAEAVQRAAAAGQGQVCLLIGPEGGFAPEEVRLAEAAGAIVASLGPRTLRSETAALAAVTLSLLNPMSGPIT